jgi:CheY-like chemotaxis protein
LPKKQILIVDDDPISIKILRRSLSEAGYSVISASNGRQALKIAANMIPDLIILDIVMPGLDGGEVAYILKKDIITKNIPIIFLSSLIKEREEKIRSKKDKIALLSKPYNQKKMLKEIKGIFTTLLKPPKDLEVTETIEVPKEELTRGTTFAGRYEIIEEIGKGGMGKVYRALDTEVKEEVAVKLIKPKIIQDEATIERFRNELKVARKVSHRNICRMHDLGKAEEGYYITMEYVEGEDLKSLIRKKGKLSTDEAIGIAQQVCEGLAEAHELGVVHRDMKPQNIMIDKNDRAKIMDFGIARSVEVPRVTATGMIIGTPDYFSPEQAEGEEADQRSDIYSLGVILYEMVTGSVPFEGDTALSVALKHKSQLPLDPRKLNPDVSDDLSRLILICMEKERERRYQKAEELLADLRNIEEGFPLGTKIRPRRETFPDLPHITSKSTSH